jgi:hypothetical protein
MPAEMLSDRIPASCQPAASFGSGRALLQIGEGSAGIEYERSRGREMTANRQRCKIGSIAIGLSLAAMPVLSCSPTKLLEPTSMPTTAKTSTPTKPPTSTHTPRPTITPTNTATILPSPTDTPIPAGEYLIDQCGVTHIPIRFNNKNYDYDIEYCITTLALHPDRQMQLNIQLRPRGTSLVIQNGWDSAWFSFSDDLDNRYEALELGGCFTGNPTIVNGRTCEGWVRYAPARPGATVFDFYFSLGGRSIPTPITGIVLTQENIVD